MKTIITLIVAFIPFMLFSQLNFLENWNYKIPHVAQNSVPEWFLPTFGQNDKNTNYFPLRASWDYNVATYLGSVGEFYANPGITYNIESGEFSWYIVFRF